MYLHGFFKFNQAYRRRQVKGYWLCNIRHDCVTAVACYAPHQTRPFMLSIDDRYQIVLYNFLTAATKDNCPCETCLQSGILYIIHQVLVTILGRLEVHLSDVTGNLETTFGSAYCRKCNYVLRFNYFHMLGAIPWVGFCKNCGCVSNI